MEKMLGLVLEIVMLLVETVSVGVGGSSGSSS